jgi:predicted outer membrane protein
MKRHTVILPLLLPQLSDRAAAQLLDVLHAILAGIEHHYAQQAQCYHQRQQQLRQDRLYRRSPRSKLTDPPF